MSVTTETTEQDSTEPVDTVSGGKVWIPEIKTASNASNSSTLSDVAAYVIFFGSLLLSVGSIFVVGLSSFLYVYTPERISMQSFASIPGYQIALPIIALIFAACGALVFLKQMPRKKDRSILLSIFLCSVLLSSLPMVVKDDILQTNAWAEQYGYKFSAFDIPNMFLYPHSAEAINLETGEKEILTLKEVNGNLTWEGMGKVTDNPELLQTVEVKVGEENIVDSVTGIEYTLSSKDGELVFTPLD